VHGRALSASVEGDLALSYTPGPVEHVLDLVLAEVVGRSGGAVRLVFQSEETGHLRVRVSASGPVGGGTAAGDVADRIEQARSVAAALGGRIVGDDPAQGIEVLLPRR
jgi:hypothetical protein